jgi:hypothetical protein
VPRLAVVCTLTAAWSLALVPAGAFEVKNRAQFTAETPFGTIAWAGTTEEHLNRNQLNVVGACEALEKNKTHYFLINHRDAAREGTVGYFFVEIHIYKKVDPAAAPSVEYVGLERNKNWADKHDRFGVILDKKTEAEQLFAVHADPAGSNNIPAEYRDWHAASKEGAKNTYEQSGFRVRAEAGQPGELQRQNYVLIKAAISGKTRSDAIPSFDFQASDGDRGTIRLSAPEFALRPTEFHVVFGGKCP